MKAHYLFREYIWLVNTIREARKISLADINRRWLRTEMSEGVELARSTFNRHKDAIEDMFGIIIDCDRTDGYRYYISNEEVLREDSIQNWLLSMLSVNNVISEGFSLKNRILLESSSSGGEFLPLVIDAMKKSVRVKVVYQRYGTDEPKVLNFEPYCIKLFNKRWYVLGHFHRDATEDHEAQDYFGMFAFDRIKWLEMTDIPFEIDPEFDAVTYFSESFGVLVHDGTVMERVVIRAYGQERFYLRDLPIHSSQREIAEGDDFADFELYVRPTIDMSRHLLGLGNKIKILEPQWLADEVCSMHLDAISRYEDEENTG